MSSELINTLLILGAAQGLFLAVLLVTRRTNSTANRILAVAMVAFSIYIFTRVYYARGYYTGFPHLIGVSTPLIYLFGPILYLYARTVAAGGHRFRPRALLHFIPFALVTLYLLPFYLQGGEAKLAYLEALFRNGSPTDLAVIEQLQYPHGIFYVVLTILLLRRHRTGLTDRFSSLEEINLLWLRNLTIAIAAIWVLATGMHLLDLVGLGVGAIESSVTPLAVSCLVYGVGYMGLSQPEIFRGAPPEADGRAVGLRPSDPGREEVATADRASEGRAVLRSNGQIAEMRQEEDVRAEPREEGPGYQKSGLTPAEAEALMERLRRAMEEQRLFLRSQLTLQELARELAISAHNLSEVINTRAGKNFYDFVNGYRVEEVMRRLRDPRQSNLTILALAADSGFNSKATFNAFFKRHTGRTPSQYRKEQGTGE